MLTLDLMRKIDLKPIPYAQIFAAEAILRFDYKLPRPTNIIIEGQENIPKTGKVFFAMNHTDKYNYFPLQYKLWRDKTGVFTATWVKGKYFNNPGIALFMVMTNNIPTPSKGYVLTSDVVKTLGHPPSEALYRVLRSAFNLSPDERDLPALRITAKEDGVLSQLDTLLNTPRTILSMAFEPSKQDYFSALDELFTNMMTAFIQINEQAFENGHKIIVFPEGTRSKVLTQGKIGLAQMALRMKATIVPIGCSGSDDLYPGSNPFSKGGDVTYRIGEPLTPEGALAPFQIDESYIPFTREALVHKEKFRGMTDLVMERIEGLVDERYKPHAGNSTEVTGANRFL